MRRKQSKKQGNLFGLPKKNAKRGIEGLAAMKEVSREEKKTANIFQGKKENGDSHQSIPPGQRSERGGTAFP